MLIVIETKKMTPKIDAKFAVVRSIQSSNRAPITFFFYWAMGNLERGPHLDGLRFVSLCGVSRILSLLQCFTNSWLPCPLIRVMKLSSHPCEAKTPNNVWVFRLNIQVFMAWMYNWVIEWMNKWINKSWQWIALPHPDTFVYDTHYCWLQFSFLPCFSLVSHSL